MLNIFISRKYKPKRCLLLLKYKYYLRRISLKSFLNFYCIHFVEHLNISLLLSLYIKFQFNLLSFILTKVRIVYVEFLGSVLTQRAEVCNATNSRHGRWEVGLCGKNKSLKWPWIDGNVATYELQGLPSDELMYEIKSLLGWILWSMQT